jgi:hypothetical protein
MEEKWYSIILDKKGYVGDISAFSLTDAERIAKLRYGNNVVNVLLKSDKYESKKKQKKGFITVEQKNNIVDKLKTEGFHKIKDNLYAKRTVPNKYGKFFPYDSITTYVQIEDKNVKIWDNSVIPQQYDEYAEIELRRVEAILKSEVKIEVEHIFKEMSGEDKPSMWNHQLAKKYYTLRINGD